ncbi:MAG: sugar ABC transporter permease [Aquiluna sp.]|jgi:raffinose/stachyose/melibiose transport system permease protein
MAIVENRVKKATLSAKNVARNYPLWFLIPGLVVYFVLFAIPTFSSLFFSLTRWTFFDIEFIGLDNYELFLSEPYLVQGVINTFIYAFLTSGAKVVIGMALGIWLSGAVLAKSYLRAVIFFPVLVSTIGVGITFKVLLNPGKGLVNQTLTVFGIEGPFWLTDPAIALYSVAMIDIWKGVGIATVIYLAGIAAIPQEYREAALVDGAGAWQRFKNITLPLLMPATSTVIVLSLIGGLRSFDLIWATTKGGPGFASDVLASVVFKQYQAGFYGLSTAGNVILFVLVAVIVYPLSAWLNRKTVEA